jgi:outer membrane protein OmpA-like peptidoglycan-associated protein
MQPMRFVTSTIDGATTKDGQDFVLLADVMFAYNSADLTRRARTELRRVAGQLTAAGATGIRVVGHTDSDGTPAYNDSLSRRRARAVGDYLSDRLPGVAVTTAGKGESEPRADNTNSRGRSLNRRVEISISSGG